MTKRRRIKRIDELLKGASEIIGSEDVAVTTMAMNEGYQFLPDHKVRLKFNYRIEKSNMSLWWDLPLYGSKRFMREMGVKFAYTALSIIERNRNVVKKVLEDFAENKGEINGT